MNEAAAFIYWVIVAIWLTILSTCAAFYATNRRTLGTTQLLLAVLALDALRNVIENIYFGLYFGSKLGFLPAKIAAVLGDPHLLILPKLGNVCAGCIVLGLLFLRWLPQALREREEAARQVAYLHELATIDYMTGLQNRREFMSLTEAEWARGLRYQRNLSLVIIDIDDFKAINDLHGHHIGDAVIAVIGKLCREVKRVSDVAGRIGGEEFAVLLPETTTADANIFAQRLRLLISSQVIEQGNVAVTVSIGVSNAAHAASVFEMIRQADIALYEAKRAGRNRVCHFEAAG
jgi:diguanylate cyclase (GGDEF)-like protein